MMIMVTSLPYHTQIILYLFFIKFINIIEVEIQMLVIENDHIYFFEYCIIVKTMN